MLLFLKRWWLAEIILILAVAAIILYFFIGRISADVINPGIITGNVSSENLDLSKSDVVDLSFELTQKAYVNVYISDSAQRIIKNILPAELSPAKYGIESSYNLTWDGTDNNAIKVPGGKYIVYFDARNSTGTILGRDTKNIQVAVVSSTVTVEPNSFDPKTAPAKIVINIPTSATFRLVVKDTKGTILKTISDFASVPLGTYNRTWDGKNNSGTIVSNGEYTIANEVKDTNGNISLSSSAKVIVSSVVVPKSSFYGNGIGANSLANLQIGRYVGATVSYRFKASKSGGAPSVLIFLKNNIGKCSQSEYDSLKCYYHGNGGQVKLELKTDDGSANHFPGNTVLATALVTNPMATNWQTFTFNQQPNLIEGQLYHMVFTNPAPDSVNNFVSVNDIATLGGSPMQPAYNDTDMAVVWKYSGSANWSLNRGHTPIFSLNYSDGSSQGNGYMDVPSAGRVTVSGASKARETFTVSSEDKTVAQLSVRVASGSGTMKLRLEDSDGALIEEGQIAGSGWITYAFKAPHTLTKGKSYNVVFSSVSGSFVIPSVQDGSSYGFGKETVFSDGFAQKSSGSSWSSMNNYDLQFYMK